MNQRLNTPDVIKTALIALIRALPHDMRAKLRDRRAKIIIIDGETHFIDMDPGGKYDRQSTRS